MAPGRINLIGEHTDYNDGFVLPAAIDRSIVFGMNLNDGNIFRFYSIDYDEYFETKEISQRDYKFPWVSYLIGVLAQFQKEGISLKGIDCVFGGDIPIGSGLSSSAAIECGFATGLNELYKANIEKYQLTLMAQKAEHEYAGVLCGIMDQYASMFGRKDQVFKLDCRDHEHEYFPLDLEDHVIVLCDTRVKHKLADSAYNKRRQECDDGVRTLQEFDRSVIALRDADQTLMQKHKDSFDPLIFKRCMYVVKENQRVLKACKALKKKDFKTFGLLMYQSHEGLQRDYEVSCDELDVLVDLTREMDFVLGSRMMGGGFGGCTINLIEKSSLNNFTQLISKGYKESTGMSPNIYSVKIEDGAKAFG